jgi:hypothetical protein
LTNVGDVSKYRRGFSFLPRIAWPTATRISLKQFAVSSILKKVSVVVALERKVLAPSRANLQICGSGRKKDERVPNSKRYECSQVYPSTLGRERWRFAASVVVEKNLASAGVWRS